MFIEILKLSFLEIKVTKSFFFYKFDKELHYKNMDIDIEVLH